MKLCKDCKHYEQGSMFHFCTRDVRLIGVSPVTGEDVYSNSRLFADEERRDSKLRARWNGSCGKEARFFEPKA